MTPVRRITLDALLLAVLCVVGMFSIPLGDNVKVSLQLLAVYIIALIVPAWYDGVIITGCYLLLGLFLPIYAGFSSWITPTFGYVIAFVVASPVIFFMNKIPKVHPILRMTLACLTGLLIVYAIGTLFLCLYLNMDLGAGLLISVVPYLPFDAIKIALAVFTVHALPMALLREPKKKGLNEDGSGPK